MTLIFSYVQASFDFGFLALQGECSRVSRACACLFTLSPHKMEACPDFPHFSKEDLAKDGGVQTAIEEFNRTGVVCFEKVLMPKTAAALLAHVNNELADQLKLKQTAEKSDLKQSIVGIMGGMPLSSEHSLDVVVDYLLDSNPDLIGNLDGAVEMLLASLEDPTLDAQIHTHQAEVKARLVETSELGGTAEYDSRRFGNVHAKSSRWDFHLELDPLVSKATSEVAACLSSVLCGTHVGPVACLCELSTIVSDPGSTRQPLHSDTRCEENDAKTQHNITLFCALQPITAAMGPTVVFPCSHNRVAQIEMLRSRSTKGGETTADAPVSSSNAGGADNAKTTPTTDEKSNQSSAGDSPSDGDSERQPIRCCCDAGDVVMMDSRALHYGGANVSDTRRVLFYMSFNSGRKDQVPAFGSTLSLLPEYKDRFSLGGEGTPPWLP